jgi:hypothetical protein
MYYPKFLEINVRCPKNRKIEKIAIKKLPIKENLVAPVQGCENLDGSLQCQQCCAALTIMFNNKFDYIAPEIIEPDLSILK